jgi:hypothetical protein
MEFVVEWGADNNLPLLAVSKLVSRNCLVNGRTDISGGKSLVLIPKDAEIEISTEGEIHTKYPDSSRSIRNKDGP